MAEVKLARKAADTDEVGLLWAPVRRAEGGGRTAIPALREKLAAPGVADDIARRAVDRLLDSCCGTHLAAWEAMAVKMAQYPR